MPQEITIVDDADGFLERLRSATPNYELLAQVREEYGEELPDDVIEEIARQKAVAMPLLQRYALINEDSATLVMARAARMREIEIIEDIFVGFDLADFDDDSAIPPEYQCPRCDHRWAGAPNKRTGYGEKVFIPTGRINPKTGRLQSQYYGPMVGSTSLQSIRKFDRVRVRDEDEPDKTRKPYVPKRYRNKDKSNGKGQQN